MRNLWAKTSQVEIQPDGSVSNHFFASLTSEKGSSVKYPLMLKSHTMFYFSSNLRLGFGLLMTEVTLVVNNIATSRVVLWAGGL